MPHVPCFMHMHKRFIVLPATTPHSAGPTLQKGRLPLSAACPSETTATAGHELHVSPTPSPTPYYETDYWPPEVTGRIEDVPKDGNCLFHSFHRELVRLSVANLDIPTAAALRHILMEWIAKHGDKTECAELTLAQWIELETEESLEQYVTRMSRNAEWGGIIELYAYTEMFEVTTYVWEALKVDNGQTPRFALRHSLEGRHCASSRRDLGTMVQTVHLFYNGTNHYAVFVPDTPDATAHLPQASPTLRGAGSAESAESILMVAEETVQDELADMIACSHRQKVVHAAWQVSM